MRKASSMRWPDGLTLLDEQVLVSLQKRTDPKLHPLLAIRPLQEGIAADHQHR